MGLHFFYICKIIPDRPFIIFIKYGQSGCISFIPKIILRNFYNINNYKIYYNKKYSGIFTSEKEAIILWNTQQAAKKAFFEKPVQE
jgi:hypothetical protein